MTRTFHLADLTFNTEDRGLSGPGTRVVLRPKVAEFLQLLVTCYPGVVDKGDCLDLLWPDTHVEPRALAQLVVELRKALATAGGSRDWIENIPKGGYRWREAPQPAQGSRRPAVPGPVTARTARSSPLGVLLGSAILFCLLVGFTFIRPLESGDSSQPVRLAILPAETGSDTEDGWLKYAYPELLGEALAKTGLVEVVGFEDVYRLIADKPAAGMGLPDRQDSPVRKLLGANAVVRIEIGTRRGIREFIVSTAGSSGETSFSFLSSDPSSTMRTVANRILTDLGLAHPAPDFFDDPFLNESFAQGHERYLKGEYKRAEPFFAICFDQRPDFGRHAYYLAYSRLHLREFEGVAALLDDPRCPKDSEWDYLRAEWSFAKRDFQASALKLNAILQGGNPDRVIRARAHHLLGIILTRGDRPDLGLEHFRKAIEGHRQMGYLSGWVNSLKAELKARHYLGLDVEDREWHELIDLAKLLENRAIEGQALIGLGDNYFSRRDWPRAYAHFEQSLGLRQVLGDSAGEGVSLSSMGSASIMLRRFDRAATQLEAALTLYEKHQDSYNQINQYLNLGYLYLVQLKLSRAEDYYRRAATLSRARTDTHGEVLALQGLAETALHRGELDQAEELLDRGEALGSTHGTLRASFKRYRAVLAYKRKDARLALELMLTAKSMTSSGNWDHIAQSYLEIYQTSLRNGNFQALPYEQDPFQGPDSY